MSVARRSLLLCSLLLPATGEAEFLDNVSADFSLRGRTEYLDWFQPSTPKQNDEYSFSHSKLQFGLKIPSDYVTLVAQGQYSQLYNLPKNGIGIGANYALYGDGESYPGDLILRLLKVGLTVPSDLGNIRAQAGRFLYANGGEVVTKDQELEALKSKRIHNRVIGSFDFALGRSFDGIQASLDLPRYLTLSGGWMRPTQGGFDTDGSAEIEELQLATAAVTSRLEDWWGRGELQLFSYFYDDSRDGILKIDNRALEVRQQEQGANEIFSFGASWVQLFAPCDGIAADSLLWAIGQGGDWGSQQHRAAALAAELGATLKQQPLTPEFRAGWNFGTGDSDPTDDKHSTFYQMLPTVRQYALSPFFNMMNTHDLFVQQVLHLSESIALTSGVHHIRLSSADDLLYAGGGANRSHDDFGFKGTHLAAKEVGALLDIGLSWNITPELSSQIYLGHLFGGEAIRETFESDHLTYGFVELTWKGMTSL